jgi:hypothetical protein
MFHGARRSLAAFGGDVCAVAIGAPLGSWLIEHHRFSFYLADSHVAQDTTYVLVSAFEGELRALFVIER